MRSAPNIATFQKYNPTRHVVKPLKLRGYNNEQQLQALSDGVASQIQIAGYTALGA